MSWATSLAESLTCWTTGWAASPTVRPPAAHAAGGEQRGQQPTGAEGDQPCTAKGLPSVLRAIRCGTSLAIAGVVHHGPRLFCRSLSQGITLRPFLNPAHGLFHLVRLPWTMLRARLSPPPRPRLCPAVRVSVRYRLEFLLVTWLIGASSLGFNVSGIFFTARRCGHPLNGLELLAAHRVEDGGMMAQIDCHIGRTKPGR